MIEEFSMKNIAYITIITWLLALPTISVAQQKLSLKEAIEIALKNSLDIQISKNNVTASSINNYIGVAGGLPTVTGTAVNTQQLTSLNQVLSNGTTTDRSGVNANNLNMGVTGTFLLYNGSRVITTKKRLEELQKLSEQQLNSSVQNVIANVMLRYYAIVQQQGFLNTLNQSIEVSKQKLAIIDGKRSVGMSNDADLFQAQLDLNAQLQALQTQNMIIAQAKADFLRTLTMKADSKIEIADTILVDKSLLLEDVLNSTSKHPDILAAEKQISINQLLEKEADARRYPSLSLNGGFNYVRTQSTAGFTLLNQTYGPTLGLNLSVPIYTGTTVQRQVKVANMNTQNAKLQKQIIEQNYQATAARAWETYSSSLQLVESEKQNYELAAKLLGLISQKFEMGQATIIDVKQAQQTFENSGYRLINLNYNAKIAEITLKQMGYLLNY